MDSGDRDSKLMAVVKERNGAVEDKKLDKLSHRGSTTSTNDSFLQTKQLERGQRESIVVKSLPGASPPLSAKDDEASKGRKIVTFPMRLHRALSDATMNGNDHIISWQEHGRAFQIHRRKDFVKMIMPQ
jgi:hypothetical protein